MPQVIAYDAIDKRVKTVTPQPLLESGYCLSMRAADDVHLSFRLLLS